MLAGRPYPGIYDRILRTFPGFGINGKIPYVAGEGRFMSCERENG